MTIQEVIFNYTLLQVVCQMKNLPCQSVNALSVYKNMLIVYPERDFDYQHAALEVLK
ncbi:MAG: hypothetical protein GX495_03360 [Chloroflexi bacterium]|nr:hypothetical protein [Chloroflexota bacterium]